MAARGGTVPEVSSLWVAAQLAMVGKPFIVNHSMGSRLGWADDDAEAVLDQCSYAGSCSWHALLSLDGVVGAYDRKKWSAQIDEAAPEKLCWVPLLDQCADAGSSCTRPRHHTTEDSTLEVALELWKTSREKRARTSVPGQCSQQDLVADGPLPQFPFAYLRGALPAERAEELLAGTDFADLQFMSAFGGKPFSVTLYASSAGMQTNLHADEHGGFLVQVLGYKRVVLFDRAASRTLRCKTWGQLNAPINRRAWIDDGVPDEDGWHLKPPFASLQAFEVEVGPGQALYIPKGYFHDVLSRSQCTMGAVLRCH